MPTTLTLASLLTLLAPAPRSPVCLEGGAPVPVLHAQADEARSSGRDALADDRLRELYEGGASYRTFLDGATRRADLWHGNTEKAEAIDPGLVERARAVGGTWRFLAVAIDACSDSVSTIPYLARLVDQVDGLEMRIVDSTVGRAVMEAHPTPDGRPATPTVLLLDSEYDETGCFIERPPTLQTWILESAGEIPDEELFQRKMAWYADDAGQETLEAFVAMLEAAASGGRVCG